MVAPLLMNVGYGALWVQNDTLRLSACLLIFCSRQSHFLASACHVFNFHVSDQLKWCCCNYRLTPPIHYTTMSTEISRLHHTSKVSHFVVIDTTQVRSFSSKYDNILGVKLHHTLFPIPSSADTGKHCNLTFNCLNFCTEKT